MTAPDTLTLDLDVPRWPSLGDVGGASLEDDSKRPPDKTRMPYADQLNQWARLLEAYGRVLPAAVISVKFTTGTPSIDSFVAVRPGMTTPDFTVTDNGTGDTSITWAADTFPVPKTQPTVTINEAGAFDAPVGVRVSNGVQVTTKDGAGSATDANFTVTVY